MWAAIRTIIVCIISSGLTLLAINKDNVFTRAESPPVIYRSLFSHTPPTPDEIKKYQEDLIAYIYYLEQHYISVGLYYDGKKELPIFQHRNDGCRVYEHTFREISIPDLPIGDEDIDTDLLLYRLAEDVIQLRGRIKEYNAYIDELKRYYRPCYDPQ